MSSAPPEALLQRRYTQLHGSSDALALARLAQQVKPLIVFCASALDAQRLREEVNRAQRNGEPLSCLFVDLDRFKGINDRYGHQAGDRILNEVAKLLSLQMRASDVLARYGGEEFSILLSATPSAKAAEIAERIRACVAAQRFEPVADVEIEVTLSIGVATLHPLSGQTHLKAYGEELVGLADAALFEAKETGRNKVVCGGEIHAEPKPGRQEVLV